MSLTQLGATSEPAEEKTESLEWDMQAGGGTKATELSNLPKKVLWDTSELKSPVWYHPIGLCPSATCPLGLSLPALPTGALSAHPSPLLRWPAVAV